MEFEMSEQLQEGLKSGEHSDRKDFQGKEENVRRFEAVLSRSFEELKKAFPDIYADVFNQSYMMQWGNEGVYFYAGVGLSDNRLSNQSLCPSKGTLGHPNFGEGYGCPNNKDLERLFPFAVKKSYFAFFNATLGDDDPRRNPKIRVNLGLFLGPGSKDTDKKTLREIQEPLKCHIEQLESCLRKELNIDSPFLKERLNIDYHLAIRDFYTGILTIPDHPKGIKHLPQRPFDNFEHLMRYLDPTGEEFLIYGATVQLPQFILTRKQEDFTDYARRITEIYREVIENKS